MSVWVEALRRPISEDLRVFLGQLHQLGISYRVAEQAEMQVLYVTADRVASVRVLYRQEAQVKPHFTPLIPDQGQNVTARRAFWGAQGVFAQMQTSRNPATLAVVLSTLLIFCMTQGGENLAVLRWFTFVDVQIRGDYLYFFSWSDVYYQHQWWRLVTPALVHFGLLHWVMDALWFWELSRRIEWVYGAWRGLALIFVLATVTNTAQYLWGGPSIFGGLSGVVYGLLGYCGCHQRYAPRIEFQLPKGVLGFMLFWLILCASGLVEVLSFGQMSIANAAHISGLIAGVLIGFLQIAAKNGFNHI